ncbi:hypothetical protein ACU64V_03290 [Lysinibacillus capsici]
MNPKEKIEQILKGPMDFFKSLDNLPEINNIDDVIVVGSHLEQGARIVNDTIQELNNLISTKQ